MKNSNALGKHTLLRTFALALGMLFTTWMALAQVPGHGVVSSVTSVSGCVAYTPAQGSGPDNWEVAQGGTYNVTLTGVTECTGTTITVFVQSSFNGNFCFNATGGNGTYSGTVTMPNPACFTMPISYKCGANQPCNNSNAYDADGPSGNGKVHFRMSNFDGSCVRTGSDGDCGTCEATIGINVEGTTSICPGNCVTLTATGGVSYEWSNGETGPSIEVCEAGDYSVAGIDGNGCTGSSASIHISVLTPPTVELSLSTNDPICDGECVTITASGADSYLWNNGETSASISACEEGDYSVVGSDANGCTSAEASVHITVNPRPTCDIIEPTTFPVYGLGNNPLSATVDCPAGCNCSYEWALTSNDGSWVIQTNNGLSITYYCGNNGTTGHFSLTVTCNETGCSSTCNLDISSQAQEHCAYTQGFYGNNNGQNGGFATCVGLRVEQAINQALNYPSCNPIVVGYGSKTLTVPCDAASIQCLMTKMPGGGTSAALTNTSNVNVCNATGTNWVGNNGKFKNTLLGQALALSINVRLFPNLANVKITSSSFTTYEATACQNGNAIPGTGQTFSIPQSIINCLGTVNNKVSDLLVLANKRLGAQTTCGSIAFADVTAALDAVNRGFDKCRINSTANIRFANSAFSDESGFELVAYPNPTSGLTTIEFVATTGTHASVKVYALDGSLKANLLDDEVPLGATAKVNFDASSWASGIYFVNLIVGEKAAFQKIVIMN